MVFGLDRKPFDRWIVARAFGNRPRRERTIDLEPQVVVQMTSVMLVNHERWMRRV